jgi:hypothetical protein
MESPNINIDNINFRLDGYNPPNEIIDRAALKITSRILDGTTFELYLYQSETSLGFWRLGCNNRGVLYKGENDYVQQTFIHLRLQEFINQNISKVKDIRFTNTHPELDAPTRERVQSFYPDILNSNFPFCYTKLRAYACTLDYYITRIINDPRRMIEIPAFSEFNKVVEQRCGNWKINPQEYLQTIAENFSKHYNLVKDSIHFLFNGVYEYASELNSETTVRLNIIYNIFICQLVSQTAGPDLYLYYTNYKIVNKDTVKEGDLFVDNFYFPLFLTTNTRITPFGVYENYVLCAGYICKLFEYRLQSTTFGKLVSKDHCYIGFLYNDLFPFNEIKK